MDGSTMSAAHKTARTAPFLRGFTNSPWTGGGAGGGTIGGAPSRLLISTSLGASRFVAGASAALSYLGRLARFQVRCGGDRANLHFSRTHYSCDLSPCQDPYSQFPFLTTALSRYVEKVAPVFMRWGANRGPGGTRPH